MDGGPQRANAAQLAARKIKDMKPMKGRRGGAPIRHDNPTQQSNPSQGGGGLFGGSVQGAGTFNFSAPAGGLSFPPPSFGGGNVNNPFGMSNASSPEPSDNEGDRPGDDRATKKRFGSGPVQQGNAPFQTPNIFGQSQLSNPFGSANAQQTPNGGIFSFGEAQQPQSSGINFNSSTATDKPASNIFSFGAPSQPPASTPSINFGGTSENKPVNNIFSFGQQPAQAPAPSTGFSFGAPSQAPAEKPASNPFSFGQASSQPPTTNTSFSSTAATEAPASNLFGTPQTQQPALTTNLFGSTSQQPASPNIFANLNTPAAPTSNLYGSREQSPAPATNNLFGGLNQQPAENSNNLFANSSQAPPSPNPFGEQKSQPSSNMFGTRNKTPTSASSLFSKPSEQPAPTSNLFGGPQKQNTSTDDLFGNLNKPVDQPVAQPNLNGTASASEINSAPSTSSSSLFNQQTPSTNLFGASKPLVSTSTLPLVQNKTNHQKFSAMPAQSESSTTPNKPAFSFGSTQSFGPQANKTAASPTKSLDAPTSATQPPPTGMFPSLSQPQTSPLKSNEALQKQTPSAFSSLAKSTASVPSGSQALVNGGQGKTAGNGQRTPRPSVVESITEDFMDPMIPKHFTDEQRKDFYAAYRMRALNKTMEHFFANIGITGDPTSTIAYYNEQRALIMHELSLRKGIKRKGMHEENQENVTPNKRGRHVETLASTSSIEQRATSPAKNSLTGNNNQPYLNGNASPKPQTLAPAQPSTPSVAAPTPKGKRKAEEQLTKDQFEQEEENRPAGQIKTPKGNGAGGGSNTSNIFKNILDSPSQSSTLKASPTKKTAPTPETSKDDAPSFNPFGNISVPKSPTKSTTTAPPTSNLFSPKPTGTSATSNLFSPKPTTTPAASNSNPFSPKPSTCNATEPKATEQKSNSIKPPTFGSGPVNFLAQFGQKAQKDEKDNEEKLMQKAKDEDMDSDEDEGEWEAKWKEKRRAELKELDELAKENRASFVVGKGFSFGQAEKSSEKSASETPAKVADSAQTASKPLFGQNATSQSSGNSVFSPLNVSRTSTPGPVSSAPGSVFDGHTPGKPVSFGSNIFGHLSDSGADSGKSDDADDESGDEDTDADGDSENKDPSYKPNEDTGSGPGTPVEETGPGIASAKKSNPFSFGASKLGGTFGASSNSGTSTPGGSLFDRVTKDSNGNPVRHISSEEKENTQPGTSNIFGDIKNPFASSLNKTPGAPADQTWKPDSPIRFGSSTPTPNDSAPTLSVTAATPTKGSPSNIFGNLSNPSGPTSAPFSNLFGSSSNSIPAASTTVGFNFGGASSTTSSLFPSAATSRATSPGATTDGDSAVEGDPDAEKHEQIDLTAGGPGEEEEEVVHEVRSKALKFSPKEDGDPNQWETKGVGPLRVLKHKETKVARILMRGDPSGKIILNKGILPNVNYEPTGKTMKLLTAADDGKGLETWILQVKTPEFAQKLAEVLEANKAS
jgi:hypothetical protein